MNKTYETLSEYLDDLDQIKERIAAETEGLDPEQVKAYFAQARKARKKLTRKKSRTRRTVGRRPVIAE
jgi:hypothetical protein